MAGRVMTLEIITPARAAGWLDTIPAFRPHPRLVGRLACEITSGHWKLTPCPIKIDTAGRPIDGRHRLAAIVEANLAVPMLVVYGLDPASFAHIPTGATR